MKKQLESELISIAHKILKLAGREDLGKMEAEISTLYQKITILKFLEDNQLDPITNSKDLTQTFFDSVTPAEEGIKKITTETGAGQWGSALSFACQHFGIQCEVFMVKLSYLHKPYRKVMMNTWGATVHPSPSDATAIGKKILSENPDTTGSLGIAISEAVERAATNEMKANNRKIHK